MDHTWTTAQSLASTLTVNGTLPAEVDEMDDRQRIEWLYRTLGESACRRLGIFFLPEDFTLSVVIPVYNELATIHEILARVRSVPISKEIILVDDCSTDGTRELLKQWEKTESDLRIAFHEVNQGKGSGLQTGFSMATGDVIVIQDADLEYDPSEYTRLVQPIVEGRADVVYGSRFIGETHRVLNYWHSVANKFLTMISNAFTNLNLTDMEVCYKVFKREVVQNITLREKRFGVEPEITAKVARYRMPSVDGKPGRRCRIYELPVSYNGRDYSEGKHIGPKDALVALYCILRYRLGD